MAEREYVQDTFESYLGKKTHISASDIKNFLHSPRFYFYKKYEEKKEDTDRHFIIGTALHSKILTPDIFWEQHFVGEKYDLRTNIGKEKHSAQQNENQGKVILFPDEFKDIQAMSESAMQNKTFLKLIENSYKELSIYSQDETTGLKIKIRPDVFCKDTSTMIDLKSSAHGGARKFKYSVYDFGYDISAAFYCNFGNKKNYLFGVFEKEKPNQFSLYQLSDSIIARAAERYRMALDLLKFCYTHNHWPEYNTFEVMKRMYSIDAMGNYFEQLENENLIITIE